MSNFIYHPAAELEAKEAFNWYLSRSRSAGIAFFDELKHAEVQVSRFPQRWPRYLHGTKRYRLKGYPYVLVYMQHNEKTIGIAVAHLHRKPNYWKTRL